ncbi:hypothetical protein ACFXP7_01725 [Microbacterium sp. P06]|uniref:hypothetical protein n=1 Tax=Microbacterium sp. P06 TaxID=3366949 RepID=UPI003745456C
MRIAVSVSLTIAATVLGLFGVLMLGVSGLSWAGPGFTIIEYSDSDDGERSTGIGMGIIALVTWLVAVMSAALVGLRGESPRPTQRATVWILLGASAVLVLGLTILVLSTPPPASEYPLPEWNRA